ncbi:MAG TPA: WXG100 family type VII secretion target [Candidatus Blautia pullicola]|jgi:uncharacterized protein YukE|uniref:WXG100 family type VII secretion target n=1 Tax=Candidatus Blautia pullicola TaxID=2838498 RepID=A0A9D2FNU9_9FIRM|nr:WXG100 family type VII secretion target [Candidatus Blautia pullicola]
MDRIEMDFRQAKQQAAQLEELAAQLKNLAAKDLQETMQSLSAAWKGESADSYMQKGVRLEENISGTARKLEQIASTIRITAQRTYEAEMRAREIAKERTYGGH